MQLHVCGCSAPQQQQEDGARGARFNSCFARLQQTTHADNRHPETAAALPTRSEVVPSIRSLTAGVHKHDYAAAAESYSQNVAAATSHRPPQGHVLRFCVVVNQPPTSSRQEAKGASWLHAGASQKGVIIPLTSMNSTIDTKRTVGQLAALLLPCS
eukprot:14701-Heterococcus_DN1.PRE.1